MVEDIVFWTAFTLDRITTSVGYIGGGIDMNPVVALLYRHGWFLGFVFSFIVMYIIILWSKNKNIKTNIRSRLITVLSFLTLLSFNWNMFVLISK